MVTGHQPGVTPSPGTLSSCLPPWTPCSHLPSPACDHAAHLSPKGPALPPLGSPGPSWPCPRSAPLHKTTPLTKEYNAFYSHAAMSQNTNTREVPHRNSPPCASRPPEPTARLVPSWVGRLRPCSLPSRDTMTALTTTRGLGSSPLFSGSPLWPLPTHQDVHLGSQNPRNTLGSPPCTPMAPLSGEPPGAVLPRCADVL